MDAVLSLLPCPAWPLLSRPWVLFQAAAMLHPGKFRIMGVRCVFNHGLGSGVSAQEHPHCPWAAAAQEFGRVDGKTGLIPVGAQGSVLLGHPTPFPSDIFLQECVPCSPATPPPTPLPPAQVSVPFLSTQSTLWPGCHKVTWCPGRDISSPGMSLESPLT